MKDYTIYVTEEIAKKAMEKGFECEVCDFKDKDTQTFNTSDGIYNLPTAEQIYWWLRKEKLLPIQLEYKEDCSWWKSTLKPVIQEMYPNTDKWIAFKYEAEDALLAAINKALDLI